MSSDDTLPMSGPKTPAKIEAERRSAKRRGYRYLCVAILAFIAIPVTAYLYEGAESVPAAIHWFMLLPIVMFVSSSCCLIHNIVKVENLRYLLQNECHKLVEPTKLPAVRAYVDQVVALGRRLTQREAEQLIAYHDRLTKGNREQQECRQVYGLDLPESTL